MRNNPFKINTFFLLIVFTTLKLNATASARSVIYSDTSNLAIIVPDTTIDISRTMNDTVQLMNSTTATIKNEAHIDSSIEETAFLTSEKTILDSVINFNINALVHYITIGQFRDSTARQLFIDGFTMRIKAKSIVAKTSDLRAKYEKATTLTERTELSENIYSLEKQTFELFSTADSLSEKARVIETEFWKIASEDQLIRLQSENDSIEEMLKPKPIVQIQPMVTENISADSILENSEPLLADTIVTSSANAEKTTNTLSSEIVYKVQIGTYYKVIPEGAKKIHAKLSQLRTIDKTVDEKGNIALTIGSLKNFTDAAKLQAQIRLEGVKDAFVVSYQNGKRIPINDARKISGQ